MKKINLKNILKKTFNKKKAVKKVNKVKKTLGRKKVIKKVKKHKLKTVKKTSVNKKVTQNNKNEVTKAESLRISKLNEQTLFCYWWQWFYRTFNSKNVIE